MELYDVTLVPKVIDFGVAKATNQQLTERTLYTGLDQMVGTPLYMSPEQAELSGLDIDTRTDVYSLGVLLYELSTGTTPFDKKTLKEANYDEMRRIIREEAPPSEYPYQHTAKRSSLDFICRPRHRPRKLYQTLKGELDWIVMQALEKNRTRRYESASAFAADVERYLGDEPVEACPPSTMYRLKKYTHRNKAVLVTLFLIATSLLVGTAFSLWQANDANNVRNLANDRLLSETEARKDADEQRKLAQQNFQKARDAVDRMLTNMAQERLPQVPEMKEVRRALLQDAMQFHQEFLEQNSSDPTVRSDAALAQVRVALIHRLLGDSLTESEEFKQAADMLEKLIEEFPNKPRYQLQLVDILTELGWAQFMLYMNGPAETTFNKARRLAEKLVANDPSRHEYQYRFVRCQARLGNVTWNSAASETLQQCRESLPTAHRLVAEIPTNVHYRSELEILLVAQGRSLTKKGRTAEAEIALREAYSILTEASNTNQDSSRSAFNQFGISFGYQHGFFRSCAIGGLAECHKKAGRLEKAEKWYRRDSELYNTLIPQYPKAGPAHI